MTTKHQIINTFQLLMNFWLMASAVATPAIKLQKTPMGVSSEHNVKHQDMQMIANDYSPISLIKTQAHQFLPTPISIFPTTPAPPQISERIDRQYFEPPRLPLGPHYFRVAPSTDFIPNTRRTHRAQYQRSNSNEALIGSGDFGVLRGGTFYPKDEAPYHNDEYSDYSDNYGDPSSHAGAEFIQKYTYPEEQFEHFRDFADLNMEGIDGDFSQLSTVYTSKNATRESAEKSHPRNIIEQLELIDREKALAKKKTTARSKTKVKLAVTKLAKSYKKQSVLKNVDNEPLLALS